MDENRKDQDVTPEKEQVVPREKTAGENPVQETREPEQAAPAEESPAGEDEAKAEDAAEEEKPKFTLNLDDEAMDSLNPLEEAPSDAAPQKGGGKKKKKKKKQKSLGVVIAFTGVIVGISVLLAGFILLTLNDVMGLYKEDKDIQVIIPRDSTTKDIAEILQENGVINHAWLFRFVVKMNGEGGNFQYGIYNLNSQMPYEEIIDELQQNAPKLDAVRITIKEGETLQDVAQALEDAEVCPAEDFINVINKQTFDLPFEEYVENDPLKFHRIEGYVFPDTYEFYLGQAPESVAKTILTNFENKITTDLWGRMEELNMSLEDTITLASIIQAEAGDPAEMKKVAGVFYNRLENPEEYPKLESDPTRKYVEEYIKPYDALENEEMYKAYNTYEGDGLPPGPICNPGLDAIKAALYPEDNDYYYFCSNLETKEFFYAKTLQQHNANLRKAGLR